MTALDRLQADIVAGRSLDVAPFNTIASLQTLHRTAAAELGLDVGATTAQIAQALNESASREAARASLARARRLEGPAAAAAAISRAQALAQQLTERTEWADEDRALAGALTALLDLSECDPADLERLLACEATARAGLPDDLLGLCALAGRGVHLSNGASQVPAASRVPADQPVTGALLTEPVVAPEQAEARAPAAVPTVYAAPLRPRRRRGRRPATVGLVAVLVVVGLGVAQTSPGGRLLRALGISSPSEPYTEIAFVNPGGPWTRAANATVGFAFWVHNVEGSAHTYRWIATTQAPGRAPITAASGRLTLADGASNTVRLRIPVACTGGQSRVNVSLGGAHQTIGFWLPCA